MELEIEQGRLADAERLIKNVNDGPRNDLSDAGILLGPIYCQQGRLEEAKQLIKSRWDHLNQVGQGPPRRPSIWFGYSPRSGRTPCRSKRLALFLTRPR